MSNYEINQIPTGSIIIENAIRVPSLSKLYEMLVDFKGNI